MKQIKSLAMLLGMLGGCATQPPVQPDAPIEARAVEQLGPKRLGEVQPEPAAVYLGSFKVGRGHGLRDEAICDAYMVGQDRRTRCYAPQEWPAHHEVPAGDGSVRR